MKKSLQSLVIIIFCKPLVISLMPYYSLSLTLELYQVFICVCMNYVSFILLIPSVSEL